MGEPSGSSTSSPAGEIRTFLIADVRGYTLFTQQRGDQAAAQLASRFAAVAREVISSRGGSVVELRGDEALCVFSSPRQAIIAAADLQDRFVDETAKDPSFPLPVGIGMDAGEAVPVEGGFRGAALNLAARLCGRAGPGEILASQGVVHLAGKVDGINYVSRGTAQLKNVPEPVTVIRVVAERGDPADRLRTVWQPPQPARGHRTRNLLGAAVLAVALVAALIPLVVRRDSAGGSIRAGSVGFIEATSGRLAGQVPVGDAPEAVAAGAGAVWVIDGVAATLARIDPAAGIVQQRLPIGGGLSGLAVAGGHVWVANSEERTVSNINPGSGPGEERVVARIPVGNGPLGMASDGPRLWVANSLDATVTQIDALSGTVVGTYPVGALPSAIAIGGGAVWVTEHGGNSVARLDPRDGRLIERIPVGRGPTGVAWDGRALWVTNSDDGTVSRLDPATSSVTSTVQVGTSPGAVLAAGGVVWVAVEGGQSISRLDPAGAILGSVPVGNAPRAMAAVGDRVWVAVGASARSHRGGTLTAVAEAGFDSLDPAAISDFFDLNQRAPLLVATSDGLVTLRHAGGLGGSIVVPDLATGLPVPTDQGKTYTFVLRTGIRFSTGKEVGPADVAATFERLLSRAGVAANPFLRHALAIEGADRCSPAACDLSAGIEIDEAARTVTFHLAHADPDFLRHLALPTFVILPVGTPVELGHSIIPSTGPYRVESFVPGQLVVLVRNARFQEWSRDARPDGFPDRIVLRAGMSPEQQVAAIHSGKADVMYFDIPPPELLNELETRSPQLIHPTSSLTTLGFFLNVELPPFDDVRARKAVAFALDREELAREFSAERPGLTPTVTCNILAPGLPGYVPYCPHTLNPNPEGTWSAPDLSEARRLVASSGTSGMKIEVWSLATAGGPARSVVTTLRELGYRATLSLFTEQQYDRLVHATPSEVQIGIVGFDAISGAPSELIRDAFHCPGPGYQPPVNFSHICDPRMDARIDEALTLQQTDQYAAARAWEALDHELVDLVPVVNFAIPSGPRIVSARIGNYQSSPLIGVLLDQLWVR